MDERVTKKENDLLEETLSVAGTGYAAAYRFLLSAYEQRPEAYGPQTLYFLACLAGGCGRPEQALAWLKTAVEENGWWYRPEVLEDDDLVALRDNAGFLSLKAVSAGRYAAAAARAKAVFSWQKKTAPRLFVAVHGNTQNGQAARADWEPVTGDGTVWQLETVQSAQPDGYGTFRWRYDMSSFWPVAEALERVRDEGYDTVVCGGFSAGCDMLLRAIAFSPARCDRLILQSPWVPLTQTHSRALTDAVRRKNVKLTVACGALDEDCLPMARGLYETLRREGLSAELMIQEGTRHQFPADPAVLRVF